jgi:ABC-type phosphate transport system substrate-binding protein
MITSKSALRAARRATPLACAAILILGGAAHETAKAGVIARPAQPAVRTFRHVRRFAGSGATLYGGGAQAPALAYEGSQAINVNPGVSPFSSGTVFGQLLAGPDSGDSLQFCQTGSSYGKGVLNGLDPANGPCAGLTASPTGFGIPSNVQTYADFSASDSPVSQSDYSQLLNGPLKARGEFVQVPYIADSIALFYNNSSLANKPQIQITPKTLCELADGQITNWNQIPKNPAKPSGPFYPSLPLTWVYRYDSAGTTFAFGNYLSALDAQFKPSHCQTQNYGLSSVYDPNNNSKGASGGYGVLPNTDTEQANYLAGTLNSGEIACILASPGATCYHADAEVPAVGNGSIGYVEAANALASVNSAAGVNYAQIYVTVGKTHVVYDPIKNLPAAAKQVTVLNVNQVTAAPLPAGRPNPDVVSVTGATGNCLGIVDPALYENIKTGYPIINVSSLEFTSLGNGTKAPDLQSFATFLDQTNFPKSGVTSIDSDKVTTGKTGYSQIALPAKGIAAIATCIGA